MWARDIEIVLGLWMLVSPHILGSSMGVELYLVSSGIVVISLLCYSRFARRLHFVHLVIAAGLLGSAYLNADPLDPMVQNQVAVAWLLAMFCVVPSESRRAPPGWRSIGRKAPQKS